MRIALRTFLWLQVAVVFFSGPHSAADWPMFAHDPQRSGWAKEEKALTPESAARLELKWKVQLRNEPKFLIALTAPVVASGVKSPDGVKSLVYVAGSANNFFALDAANGRLAWVRVFDSRVLPGSGSYQGTFLCPNGITATPAIDRNTGTVYVIGMDGRLYGLDLATGKDKIPPLPFVPPFSKNWSLNLADGVVYTSLSQGCGDAASGIYSIDVKDPRRPLVRRLLLSTTDSAGIWGRGGPVIGTDQRIYGQTADGDFNPDQGLFSNSVIGATLPDLRLVDYFAPTDWREISKADLDMGSGSPVWLNFRNRNLLVGGGKQGVVYLMDGKSLGGRDHQSPLFTTPLLGNDERSWNEKGIWGAVSTWRDEKGQTWVYIPMWGPISKMAPKFPQTNGPNPHGSIMAFKIGPDSALRKPSMEPVWVSGDFNLPDPVAVANGVVFAVSTGENANQESDRSQNTRPAVLYALDARTGKVLYASGNAMNSWVHFSGLAIADGRVYAVDHDSWVYCFAPKDQ